MDRIWQWAWDRYGAGYSWLMCAVGFPLQVVVWLFVSYAIVAIEKSDSYVEVAAVDVVGVLVLVLVLVLPSMGPIHLVERWAAA